MPQQDLDVAAWLRELGLDHYAQAFRAAEITASALPHLTDADLRELGLPLGPRRVVLGAIRELVASSIPRAARAPAEPGVATVPCAAERRQLTIMFVDLVGSTALAGRLDPEEMREVIRPFQDLVTREIRRWEGHVAKLMGDGILAYFGWPEAHEDEAERAVRAALAVAGTIPALVTPAGEALAVRIGIATGLVVVGDLVGQGAAREEAVVGGTPNLAARLQTMALPGKVVVSGATQRLVRGLFHFADLGPLALKGIAGPVQGFTVTGERTVQDRFEAHQAGAPLPLVGRSQELALIVERWGLARYGRGQAVLLVGEPGIGKSRLVLALRDRLRAEPFVSLRYNCSPFHTNSALHPVIEQIARAAGFVAADRATARLGKLEALAARATGTEDGVPYLADLLGLAPSGRHALPPLTTQERKGRTFRALLAQLDGLARQRAVLIVLEDAHWCDPTTLELFEQVVERIRSLPVLLLTTFRPEFAAPWAGAGHATRLVLNRLDQAEARAIVGEVAGGHALPQELVETVVERSDGVPLFVEELTRTVLELGLLREADGGRGLAARLPAVAVPMTLNDSLLARLDRLGPAKEVAQVGAVIGREFSRALLASVSDRDESRLADALDRLVAAELIIRRGPLAGPLYAFKHALVQDVAYQSLLRSRRQQLHHKVAEAIQAGPVGEGVGPPEVLAHHLTEAGHLLRALAAWLAAGERAWRRSAYREAIAHLRRGIDVAPGVPGQEGRRSLIRLHILMGAALMAAHGPRPEVIEAYEQAARLATEAGETEELLQSLWGAWFCHYLRADIPRARPLVTDLLRRAAETSDEGLALQAHHAAWTTGWQGGELERARQHAEAGMRLYDEARDHELTAFYGGHDAGVCCRNTLGMTLWLSGSPDRAAARAEEGIALARRLAHPFTLAITLAFASWVRLFRGDLEETGRLTRELSELCTGQGIPVYLATSRITEGALRVADGEDAAELIEANIRVLQGLGANARRSFQLGLLAEAHLRAGRLADGLASVAEAQRFVAAAGERWFEPELHRLQGDLLLAAGRPSDEVRRAYEVARTVAGQLGASSFELRASIRLARISADVGERHQARVVLASVYRKFSEGLTTPDLLEAKALLGAS